MIRSAHKMLNIIRRKRQSKLCRGKYHLRRSPQKEFVFKSLHSPTLFPIQPDLQQQRQTLHCDEDLAVLRRALKVVVAHRFRNFSPECACERERSPAPNEQTRTEAEHLWLMQW